MSGEIDDLIGESLISDSGKRYELEKIIGEGPRGIVYADGSGEYAIKLYFPSGSKILDKERKERLSVIKSMHLPENIVEIQDVISEPYVGYVMKNNAALASIRKYLIPDKKRDFSEWYDQGSGLRERIYLGYFLAQAFCEFEKYGISFGAISPNSFLVNRNSNNTILLLGVDDIYIQGRAAIEIGGTQKYMAPEIISGKRNPDVLSDYYSLAVLLYELLLISHPFDSRKDPAGIISEDTVLTVKLKDLFSQCFVEGKTNRFSRPSAFDFEKALLEAANSLIQCPGCGAWHYYNNIGAGKGKCPRCGSVSEGDKKLVFYDLLYEGDNYKTGREIKHKELIVEYLLRPKKNIVKEYYILRYDDSMRVPRTVGDYFSILKTPDGFMACNEFDRKGILVKKKESSDFREIPFRQGIIIKPGDELFFDVEEVGNVEIECGGSRYSFVRMAEFVEVAE